MPAVTGVPRQAPAAGAAAGEAPLIVHLIYRLGTGGLENGLVNLINHMPPGRYRHAVWCLKGYDAFRERITAPGVEMVDLGKREGKDFSVYARVWRCLRRARPDIVHLRNLGTIDFAWVARLAGVPHVIQGEHGWDMLDLHGRARKYRLLRRACRPCIDGYITVSHDLARWLVNTVGVPEARIVRVCNGVDVARFQPRRAAPAGRERAAVHHELVFGWVGRMAEVKAPGVLVNAFARLAASRPDARLRLLLVGDGPLWADLRAAVAAAGIGDRVAMVGRQDHIAEWLRRIDVFVLPSLNEGISNTILEAMASALPVIASDVGGNPELVAAGRTGMLVPPADPARLAAAMARYADCPALVATQGAAARARAESMFSLEAMVAGYLDVYDGVLGRSAPRTGAAEDNR